MSGSFNPVNLVSTVALAAVTGGGSLFAQLATQVFASIGQQLIQQMGQQLGLPQSFISQVQNNFLGDVGSFQERTGQAAVGQDNGAGSQGTIDALTSQTGASPSEIGDSQRAQNDFIRQIVSEMSESKEFREAKSNRSGGRAGGSTLNAPGWLMAMAEVLGKKLDEMADDMAQRAANISKDDPSSSTEFGVVSQQFSMLMNATNTAIKTIGEALGGMARKQ